VEVRGSAWESAWERVRIIRVRARERACLRVCAGETGRVLKGACESACGRECVRMHGRARERAWESASERFLRVGECLRVHVGARKSASSESAPFESDWESVCGSSVCVRERVRVLCLRVRERVLCESLL
jgi:hypothetical protein